jgi:2,3-bisphosphoglycerate-independent phosphoglycerate mutase
MDDNTITTQNTNNNLLYQAYEALANQDFIHLHTKKTYINK